VKRALEMAEVAAMRLRAQHLTGTKFAKPRDVVKWFGAVQAQDFKGALWGIGQRAKTAGQTEVSSAIEAREIVRTWPMRNTLHFVAAEDAAWITKLLTPRAIQKAKGRHRELGLDDQTFARGRACFEKLLEGGKTMTRPEAYAALEAAKISAEGQRGIHILSMLAMQGVLCFGAHRDKQPTFVLFGEWLPNARIRGGDEALGEIATRYFTSHGPASSKDFAWWTGLSLAEARRAIEIARANLVEYEVESETMFAGPPLRSNKSDDEVARLLPPFDELTVGYQNRDAIVDARHASRLSNLLAPVIELDGRLIGTWRRTLGRDAVRIEATPFTTFSAATRASIADAAQRYGAFLGLEATLTF
jgi:hypothetical protein